MCISIGIRVVGAKNSFDPGDVEAMWRILEPFLATDRSAALRDAVLGVVTTLVATHLSVMSLSLRRS